MRELEPHHSRKVIDMEQVLASSNNAPLEIFAFLPQDGTMKEVHLFTISRGEPRPYYLHGFFVRAVADLKLSHQDFWRGEERRIRHGDVINDVDGVYRFTVDGTKLIQTPDDPRSVKDTTEAGEVTIQETNDNEPYFDPHHTQSAIPIDVEMLDRAEQQEQNDQMLSDLSKSQDRYDSLGEIVRASQELLQAADLESADRAKINDLLTNMSNEIDSATASEFSHIFIRARQQLNELVKKYELDEIEDEQDLTETKEMNAFTSEIDDRALEIKKIRSWVHQELPSRVHTWRSQDNRQIGYNINGFKMLTRHLLMSKLETSSSLSSEERDSILDIAGLVYRIASRCQELIEKTEASHITEVRNQVEAVIKIMDEKKEIWSQPLQNDQVGRALRIVKLLHRRVTAIPQHFSKFS